MEGGPKGGEHCSTGEHYALHDQWMCSQVGGLNDQWMCFGAGGLNDQWMCLYILTPAQEKSKETIIPLVSCLLSEIRFAPTAVLSLLQVFK